MEHIFSIDSDYAKDLIGIEVLVEQLLAWIKHEQYITKSDVADRLRKIKNHAANMEGRVKQAGYAYFEELTK